MRAAAESEDQTLNTAFTYEWSWDPLSKGKYYATLAEGLSTLISGR